MLALCLKPSTMIPSCNSKFDAGIVAASTVDTVHKLSYQVRDCCFLFLSDSTAYVVSIHKLDTGMS